jgi:hypothetical protein
MFEEMACSAQSMANALYGLQLMAVQESLKNHSDAWNLAGAVFEWLKDYTTDENELQHMSEKDEIMPRSKARVEMTNGSRIARSGLRCV